MDLLWSASTTMRNPERAYPFLKTASEIENRIWNEETQMVYQSLLIKNRYYKPTKQNLSQKQIDILEDLHYEMSYEEARDIFDSKKYVDAPMRGRTSFDPIEKLGLVSLEYDRQVHENRVRITELGRQFLQNEVALEDVVFSNLLKFQYPNPISRDCKSYNTKPFINTMRLIKKVNALCLSRGEKAKGVSKDEFGIFVLSVKSYKEVDEKAEKLLEYRDAMRKCQTEEEREAFRTSFVENYLSGFAEPVKNTREYADTLNTFWTAVKYEYQGKKQKIVPLTISRLISILQGIRRGKELDRRITKDDMAALYEACVSISEVSDSTKWNSHIAQKIEEWKKRCALSV